MKNAHTQNTPSKQNTTQKSQPNTSQTTQHTPSKQNNTPQTLAQTPTPMDDGHMTDTQRAFSQLTQTPAPNKPTSARRLTHQTPNKPATPPRPHVSKRHRTSDSPHQS
jgi:hypothetical protein